METLAVREHALESTLHPSYASCEANIHACLLGDTRAWQKFVAIYKQHIINTVSWTLRRTGAYAASLSDTEDVVQEVFVRLVRGNYRLLETWNPNRGTFSTWLTVVSRSTTLDYLRDKRNNIRNSEQYISIDDCPELLGEVIKPSGNICLPKGILSPRQNSVLHLMFEKDMTPEEIAAFLDIHPQTVRSIRHSALLKLKEHYSYSNILSII